MKRQIDWPILEDLRRLKTWTRRNSDLLGPGAYIAFPFVWFLVWFGISYTPLDTNRRGHTILIGPHGTTLMFWLLIATATPYIISILGVAIYGLQWTLRKLPRVLSRTPRFLLRCIPRLKTVPVTKDLREGP